MRGLVLSCLTACSFVAVTPPAELPQPAGDCTTSFAAPGIDLLGTIATGAVGILGVAVAASNGSNCTGNDCHTAGGVGLVVGAVGIAAAVAYGASTTYGHRAVDRCQRRKKREERDERKAREAAHPDPDTD